MSKTQIYRSIVALLGIIGVSLQIQKDGWGMLLYYTVISNILVFSFLIYLIVYSYKKVTINQNPKLLRIKGGVSMAILITFVIYHFMLAPLAKPEAYWNARNFFVHYICPLAMVFDTLILDRKNSYKWSDPIIWASIPLTYFAFALLNGMLLKLPIPGAVDSPFAYYFINVYKYGWGHVLVTSLFITGAYVFVGYILLFLKTIIGSNKVVEN